jgi:predicted lipid carrier protein YhbT
MSEGAGKDSGLKAIGMGLLKEALLGVIKMKLKTLPLWVEAIGAGVFMSSVVDGNPSFKEGLKGLDGKTFLFEARDIGKSFYLSIKDSDIRIIPHMPVAPDCVMRGDVDVLFGLLTGRVDPDTVFFSRRLEIEGDTAAAIRFKNMLARL